MLKLMCCVYLILYIHYPIINQWRLIIAYSLYDQPPLHINGYSKHQHGKILHRMTSIGSMKQIHRFCF